MDQKHAFKETKMYKLGVAMQAFNVSSEGGSLKV